MCRRRSVRSATATATPTSGLPQGVRRWRSRGSPRTSWPAPRRPRESPNTRRARWYFPRSAVNSGAHAKDAGSDGRAGGPAHLDPRAHRRRRQMPARPPHRIASTWHTRLNATGSTSFTDVSCPTTLRLHGSRRGSDGSRDDLPIRQRRCHLEPPASAGQHARPPRRQLPERESLPCGRQRAVRAGVPVDHERRQGLVDASPGRICSPTTSTVSTARASPRATRRCREGLPAP